MADDIVVEHIEIQVTQDTDAAVRGINNLTKSINTLKKALSGISGMKGLDTLLKQMGDIKPLNIGNITAGTASFEMGDIDDSGLIHIESETVEVGQAAETAQRSYEQLEEELRNIGGMPGIEACRAEIGRLQNVIEEFGEKEHRYFELNDDMERIAREAENAGEATDELKEKIADMTGGGTSLDDLKDRMASVSDTIKDFADITYNAKQRLEELNGIQEEKLIGEAVRLQSELDKVNKELDSEIEKYRQYTSDYNSRIENPKQYSGETTEQQQAAIHTDVAGYTEALGNIQALQEANNSLRESMNDLSLYMTQQGGQAMDTWAQNMQQAAQAEYTFKADTEEAGNSAAAFKEKLQSTLGVLVGFGQELKGRVSSGVEQFRQEIAVLPGKMSAASKETSKTANETKKLGSASSTASGHVNKLVRSFGRIATYRAIRKAIHMVTQALQEGIQNFAMYDDDFNETMSEFKSLTSELKNSLGAMLAPLLETLMPILETIIDAIIDIINLINVMFASMNGSETVSIATKQVEDYRDSIDEATKSMLGFDEINTVGTNDTDYSSMFETVSMNDILNGEDSIAKSFAKIGSALTGVFDELGKVIDKIMPLITDLLGVACDVIEPLLPLLEPVIDIIEEIMTLLDPLMDMISAVADVFTDILGGAVKDICNLIDDVLMPIIGGIIDMLSDVINFIACIFKGDWEGAWDAICGVFVNAWNCVVDIIKGIINWFLNGVETSINSFIKAINKICDGINWIGDIFNANWNLHINEISLPRLASGGMVDAGQLFIANEAGPELVGTMGGHTTVANNGQIIEGIKQGVIEAMAESDIGGGDITVQFVSDGQIKAERVISAAQRKNMRDGKVILEVNA